MEHSDSKELELGSVQILQSTIKFFIWPTRWLGNTSTILLNIPCSFMYACNKVQDFYIVQDGVAPVTEQPSVSTTPEQNPPLEAVCR